MRRVRRRSPRWIVIAVSVALVIVVARIALPFAIHSYLNRLLLRNPQYSGQVGDVGVALYRGAYKIRDVEIVKRGGKAPVPFLKAPLIDVSVQWGALFHGKVVGKISMQSPELNFVAGPTEADRQSGVAGEWKELAEKLFPTALNRFEVSDGRVHFRNFHSSPKVDVALTHFDLLAENLSDHGERKARLETRGEFVPAGHMVMHMSLDPHTDAPTFQTDLVVRDADLAEWNDFLKAYAKVDAQRGKLSLYSELSAANGSFQGYVKPFLADVQVIDWNEVTKQNLLSSAWEAFVQGLLTAFRNHESKDVAARIPIAGRTVPRGEFWPALGSALYNAFVEGLAPRLERRSATGGRTGAS